MQKIVEESILITEKGQLDEEKLLKLEEQEPSTLVSENKFIKEEEEKDKAILTRINFSTKKREEKISKKLHKEQGAGLIKSASKNIISKISSGYNFIFPSHESTIKEYVDDNKLIENISSQIDSVKEEFKNLLIDPEKAKDYIKETIKTMTDDHNSSINYLIKQIKTLVNKKDVDFDKIIFLSTKANQLKEEFKSKIFRLQNPEKWLIEVIKKDKMNYFKDCTQAYLEEQLVTYKAIALGTVSRKSDNLEKFAKIAHVGTKIGIQAIEVTAVGMVPGIGSLGFVSMIMGAGRGLMKFYKDREILLDAKKILNHCGRRLEDIVSFSKEFSEILCNSFKNQIVHFSCSSIALFSQILVEERIPWMIHLDHDPKRSRTLTIEKLTNVVIPREYIKSLSLFDSIVCYQTLKTEEGVEFNAWRLLRKCSFKSKIQGADTWIYAMPSKEIDQKLSTQLEYINIDPFREISSQQLIQICRDNNKIKYSPKNEDEILSWINSLKDVQPDESQFHSTIPQKFLNYFSLVNYRNKSRASPSAPPSSGINVLDIADDCYAQILEIQAIYDCFKQVNENSGDTENDIFTILECLGTIIPKRAIGKLATSKIIDELSDWLLD